MKSKRQKYPKKIKNINQLDKMIEHEHDEKLVPKKMRYDDETDY